MRLLSRSLKRFHYYTLRQKCSPYEFCPVLPPQYLLPAGSSRPEVYPMRLRRMIFPSIRWTPQSFWIHPQLPDWEYRFLSSLSRTQDTQVSLSFVPSVRFICSSPFYPHTILFVWIEILHFPNSDICSIPHSPFGDFQVWYDYRRSIRKSKHNWCQVRAAGSFFIFLLFYNHRKNFEIF